MAGYDYDYYALRRDVATVAKFVNRMAAHREKLAYYQFSGGAASSVPFPKPPAKDSKWDAYGAAHRLEKALGLETHASSVPELAALVGEAMKVTL